MTVLRDKDLRPVAVTSSSHSRTALWPSFPGPRSVNEVLSFVISKMRRRSGQVVGARILVAAFHCNEDVSQVINKSMRQPNAAKYLVFLIEQRVCDMFSARRHSCSFLLCYLVCTFLKMFFDLFMVATTAGCQVARIVKSALCAFNQKTACESACVAGEGYDCGRGVKVAQISDCGRGDLLRAE